MADTLTVALRVAEEAIEEAISKAEEFSDSLVRNLSICLSVCQLFNLSAICSPFSGLCISWRESWFSAQTSSRMTSL